jgi:hypothetical protein
VRRPALILTLLVALIVACGGRTHRAADGSGDDGAGGAVHPATTAVDGAEVFDLEGYYAAASSPDITCTVLDAYAVGDSIEITVAVENPTASSRTGRLDVGIGVQDMMTMVAIDQVLALGSEAVVLAPNSSEAFSFKYTLPLSLSSDDDYCVLVLLDYDDDDIDDIRTLAPFELTALYDVQLSIPDGLRACGPDDPCRFDVDVVVENVGSITVTGLVFEFELPFGVQTLSGGKNLVLTHDELPPGQVVTKTARLTVVEPNEAANFVVHAESDNAGSTRLSRTVEIAPR